MERPGGPTASHSERPYYGNPGQPRPGATTARIPAAPHQPGTQATQTNVFAVLSLVSAVVGLFVLPGAGSVIAIIFALLARNEIAKNPQQTGNDLATWGLIIGIVGLVLWVLFALFMVFVGMLFGGFGFWGPWWRGW